MNKRQMRRCPPIAVSVIVALLLATAALKVLGDGEARADELHWSEPVADQIELQAETPTAEEMATVIVRQYAKLETQEAEPEAESTYESEGTGLNISAEDAELLLKIAMAEAEGESVEGKALVMLVVLNRVESDGFPNTVEEVIFQKRQFSVTAAGGRWYTTEPNESCQEALEIVLSGWDESQGALFFESCTSSSWQSENLEFLFEVGNHRFYR